MLRRLVLFCVMSAMLGAADASAQQFSQSQRDAMENIAQALAGTAKCPRYAVNPKMIVLIRLKYGVNITNPIFNKHIEERAIFHRNRIAGRTEQDICEAVARLFGPGGSNIAGLIVPQ